MEKFSLYNILAILLPGSVPVFVIEIMMKNTDKGLMLTGSGFLDAALLLTASVFCGVLIHIFSFKMLDFYRLIGIYTPILKIFKHSEYYETMKDYIEDKCKERFGEVKNDKTCLNTNFNVFYDWMYYTLEVEDKIAVPKSFQSFYFFFRNFFTMSMIILILIGIYNIFFGCVANQEIVIFSMIFIFFFSWFAAIWYRKNMVRKVFWTYFVFKNNL